MVGDEADGVDTLIFREVKGRSGNIKEDQGEIKMSWFPERRVHLQGDQGVT